MSVKLCHLYHFLEIHLNKLEQIIYFSNKLLVATIQLEINSFLSFL